MPKLDPIIEKLTSGQKWYVVLRKLTLNGHAAVRGEVIDTTGLRPEGIEALVNRRMLYMLPFGLKPPSATVGSDGVERRMLPGFEVNTTVPHDDSGAGEQSADDTETEEAA